VIYIHILCLKKKINQKYVISLTRDCHTNPRVDRNSHLLSHQSHGDGPVLADGFGALGAVEAAPAAAEVRDTLALFISLARLLAVRAVLEFSR